MVERVAKQYFQPLLFECIWYCCLITTFPGFSIELQYEHHSIPCSCLSVYTIV